MQSSNILGSRRYSYRHSIRATSASEANIFGAYINSVLRAGGWYNEKSFVQSYNKPLHLNDTISDTLLKK